MRQAIRKETASELMTPPAKIGSVPNRLATSAVLISAGTSGPASASQRVRRQRGKL